MRNILREKSYIKYGRETIPRRFSKKSKLSISISGSIFYKVHGFRDSVPVRKLHACC